LWINLAIVALFLTATPSVVLARKKKARRSGDGQAAKSKNGPDAAEVCELTDEEGRRFYGSMAVTGDIPRVKWDMADPKFRNQIVAAGQPVILYDTPISYKWEALGGGSGKRKWSTSFLEKELGPKTIVPVFYAKTGVYLYSSDKKQEKLNNKYKEDGSVQQFKTTSPMKNIPIRNFVRAAKKAGTFERKRQQSKAAQMGGPVSRMYYNLVISKQSPFFPLLKDIDFHSSMDLFGLSRERPPTVHVWWGPPGVRSAPHYDMSQNFYAQVFGEKTFYLAPPSANQKWRMFPYHHPAARHTMHPWPVTAGDNVDAGTLLAANLKQGDVLFLPSLWVHAAMTVGDEMSFSFSFWSSPVLERDVLLAAEENHIEGLTPGIGHAQAVLEAAMTLLTEVHGGDAAKAATELLGEVPRFQTTPPPPPCSSEASASDVWAQLTHPSPAGAVQPSILSATAVRGGFDAALDLLELRGGNLSSYGGEERMGLVYTEGLVIGLLGEQFSCAFYEALLKVLSV